MRKRYVPRRNDAVLGTVVSADADAYRVDIGYTLAARVAFRVFFFKVCLLSPLLHRSLLNLLSLFSCRIHAHNPTARKTLPRCRCWRLSVQQRKIGRDWSVATCCLVASRWPTVTLRPNSPACRSAAKRTDSALSRCDAQQIILFSLRALAQVWFRIDLIFACFCDSCCSHCRSLCAPTDGRCGAGLLGSG